MRRSFRTMQVWPNLSGVTPPGDPGYWRFLAALVDGRLRLGDTVTQDELCSILGMSLSPLRETMTLLVSEGLIDVRRRVGVTIFYPDVAFVRTTFQFRGLIEREAVRKFSAIVTDDWVEELTERHQAVIALVAKEPGSEGSVLKVRELERDLHGAFVGTFDNPYIEDVYGKLSRKLFLLRLLYPMSVTPQATIKAMEEHLAVLDALRRRDADAAAAELDRHLSGVLHRTLGS